MWRPWNSLDILKLHPDPHLQWRSWVCEVKTYFYKPSLLSSTSGFQCIQPRRPRWGKTRRCRRTALCSQPGKDLWDSKKCDKISSTKITKSLNSQQFPVAWPPPKLNRDTAALQRTHLNKPVPEVGRRFTCLWGSCRRTEALRLHHPDHSLWWEGMNTDIHCTNYDSFNRSFKLNSSKIT